jgi:mannose PTS system EIIA component
MADIDRQRLGVVVVTHGQLAHELVNAAEMIAGELVRFEAVALGWHDDPNAARDQIAAAVVRVQGPAGVLILTDMFGGTPSNLGITFLEDDQVEVITGVNLPMLVKLANLERSSAGLLGIARQVREHAREAIRVASDLMRPDAGS